MNCEVWHSVHNYQIENHLAIDKYLLRGLLGAHEKVPLEHSYLEVAALPLSYVISLRRMLYMKTILNRRDKEMVKQAYKCQKENSVPGDWCILINEDFNKIYLHMTDNQIEMISEPDYKKLIKCKTREAAFIHLPSLKESHYVVQVNEYCNLKNPQEYITRNYLNNTEKYILFGLRSQTIRGIRMNFQKMYPENSMCPMCERSLDTQEHLLLCQVLQKIVRRTR